MVDLVPYSPLESLGAIANEAARQSLLEDYRAEKAAHTLRRQENDIALFEHYLAEAGHAVAGMAHNLSLWSGTTWGLVAGFRQWLLKDGYAIGSVHVTMATIKVYCKLAAQSGYLSGEAYALIQAVHTPGGRAARNLDEKRQVTRVGRKKQRATLLSESHVALLKKHLGDDETRTRDYLLLCLLVDHGFRCGEIVALQVNNIDLASGLILFYRHKVHKTQQHQMTGDTLRAMQCYLSTHHPQLHLFQGNPNSRTHKQANDGLSTRAINKIVRGFGTLVGIAEPPLSPHDLRHYWATLAARKKTDINNLRQAGGWSTLEMPARYIEDNKIANEGVKLS